MTETRESTQEERMTWGTCPVCDAKHGEPCRPEMGFPLGLNILGERPSEGAHMGRLQAAPRRVRLVAVD